MLKTRRPAGHQGSPKRGYARLEFEKESVFTSQLSFQKGHRFQHHRGDIQGIGRGSMKRY